MTAKTISAFTPRLLCLAVLHSFKKLNPFELWRNPVIFITEIGALITTSEAFLYHDALHLFTFHVSIWLWFTVLFANFAEAIAESRNRAQAAALKAARVETTANRVKSDGSLEKIHARELKKGDIVWVRKNETIPGDGEIIHGIASIDESSITGESVPVIRASGTDQNAVTAGCIVLSDEIQVKITSNPGESFLDRMIRLIEGAKRKKTLNEIALTILLSGLTLIFLAMILSFKIFGLYFHLDISIAILVALLICLIPTTIGGLLSAIGIAGINRLMQKNVLAMSGQAVEAAGDVDTLLIDKTGTITLGNRRAHKLIAAPGVSEEEFLKVTLLTSFLDETTEGRSIVELIRKEHPELEIPSSDGRQFIPFSAESRMSGIQRAGDSE